MEEKKIRRLNPYLHEVLRSKVSLKLEEQKKFNKQLLNVLKDNLIPKMKEVDPVFKELYRKEMYTGSYYENLRVGTPDEFDLNLILKVPAKYSLQQCEPGFLKIKTTEWEQKDVLVRRWRRGGASAGSGGTRPERPAAARAPRQLPVETVAATRRPSPSGARVGSLQKLKWRDSQGYILRDNVLQWFQSVVDQTLKRVQISGCKINRSMNGPAVTLTVHFRQQSFSVDLVPVFVFGKDEWPKPPIRSPPSVYNLEDWCVVPKAPHNKAEDKRIWRMSFYPQEKGILNGTQNLKAVLKLIKLLRDKEGWHSLVSYHIKTVFMWAISEDSSLATKDLAVLFMHMLEKLKGYMLAHKIPFYWDRRYNLISNISSSTSDNIGHRIVSLQKMIKRYLDEEDPESVKWLFMTRNSVAESQNMSSETELEQFQPQGQQQVNAWNIVVGLGILAVGSTLINLLRPSTRPRGNN